MAVNLSPLGIGQLELGDGLPATGNRLFFYLAGSVGTKINTYSDYTGGVANTNPVVLNSLGMPTTSGTPTEIWFTSGQAYDIVYAPPGSDDPPSSPIRTFHAWRGINDTTVSVSQWQAYGGTPTFVNATTFTVSGDQTSIFQIQRRLESTNSGGTIYSSITNSVFGAGITTVTVVNDSGVLDSGLSAVSYGLLTPQNPSVPTTYPLKTDVQSQNFLAYTTGGTSTAYTLTPNPALTAYTAGYEFDVTFSVASGASPTLTISGVGTPPNLVKANPDGTYTNIGSGDFPSSWRSKVVLVSATQALVRSLPVVVAANWTPFNLDDRVWGAGTSAVKTSWTAYGASATYAKNTTAAQIKGLAGIAVTRVGSDCGASQNIVGISGWPAANSWQGKTVTYGRWVYATVASRARIGINDGVGQSYSSYHTGNSTLQFLTVTRTLDAAATAVTLQDQVDTGNTTGVFSGGGFVTGGSLADTLSPAWTGRKCIVPIGLKSAGLLPASNTIFLGTGMASSTESDVYQLNPFAKSVARNLNYFTSSQPGGAATHIATLRITGATDTTLTCTVTGAANSAQDLTREVNLTQFVAGTATGVYTIKAVASAGAATTGSITASIEIEEVPL